MTDAWLSRGYWRTRVARVPDFAPSVGLPPALLMVAVFSGLLSWPVEDIRATSGLDASWGAALHLANREGLNFGTEIIFTYGPLGFLTIPRLLFTPLTVASLCFIAAAHLLLAVSLLSSLTRVMHFVLAAVLTYFLLRAAQWIQPTQELVVAGLITCVAVLRPQASRRFVNLFVPAIGAAAAVVLLTKFNDGAILGAISLLTVLALAVMRSRPVLLVVYATAFAIAFAAGWFGTGQTAAAIIPYITGSLQIAAGYSAAMGLEVPGREWEYAAAALLAAGVLVVAWQASAVWPLPVRAAVLGAAGLVLFAAFKHGFVRHDAHSIGYFAVCAIVIPAFLWSGWRWRTALATVASGLMAISLVSGTSITEPLNVGSRVTMLKQQLGLLIDESVRNRALSDGVEAVRGQLALPLAVLDQVRGHRVHIDPWEASLAWAFYGEFEWTPVPGFQSYLAYTDELDERNASFLVSPVGPDRIVRQTPRSIDGRNPHWESPAYTLAMLCNFREVWVGEAWQVLERTADRCGEPQLVEDVTVSPNTPVPVPAVGPGDILVAAIHGLDRGPIDRLSVVLHKAGPVWMNVDEINEHRIVPGTAQNGLILQVPPDANYSNPFAFPPIEVGLRVYYSWPQPPEASLTIEFLSISLDGGVSP